MADPCVVAITGASAGIGRATALRLAHDGAAVALCARRRDRLEALAAEIERAGGRAIAVSGDVTCDEDMHGLVARTAERFGRLDVMICNAGFGIAGAILTESSLSYLGFGAPPPTPTWGEMISQGKEHVDTAWWLIIFPGAAIFLTVTVYNLAGDGLRDAMDPKMRK